MKKEIILSKDKEKFSLAVQEAGEVARMNNDITKSLYMADAVNQLRRVMQSKEIAEVIQNLQNSSVGFKTDRLNGYDVNTTVDCAIEALSMGLFLHGNEWNIIGGNCYPAQRGFERLLREYCSLNNIKRYFTNRIPKLIEPRGKQNVYEVVYDIVWQRLGQEKESTTLKWHLVGMTHDQVIGKAKKRAYQWLYNELTNNALPIDDEGDFDIIEGTSNTSEKTNIFDEMEKKESEQKQDVVDAEIVKDQEPQDKASVLDGTFEFDKISTKDFETSDHYVTWMISRCNYLEINPNEFKEKLIERGLIKQGVIMNSLPVETLFKICKTSEEIYDQILA